MLALFLVANTVNCSVCSCLHQTIEELQFARSCFAPGYWGMQLRGSCLVSSYHKLSRNSNLRSLALHQTSLEFQFAGSCFAPNYRGISSRLRSCVKLLGNSKLHGRITYFASFVCPKLLEHCNFNSPVLCVMLSKNPICRVLLCVKLFLFLPQAPSC